MIKLNTFSIASALVLALVLAVAGAPMAARAQIIVPSLAGDYETLTEKAAITAINPATRMVTLKGPDGAEIAMKAGPEVHNFSQIKVGDTVNAVYAQSVHFKLHAAGTKAPDMSVASAAGAAKPGAKPGAGAVQQTVVTLSIAAVDMDAKTVDLVPENGGPVQTLHVREAPRQAMLKHVKPGDLLTIVYTEAFALSVQPAASAD